jgi:hypothetical protein
MRLLRAFGALVLGVLGVQGLFQEPSNILQPSPDPALVPHHRCIEI